MEELFFQVLKNLVAYVSSMGVILDLIEMQMVPVDPPIQKTPPWNQIWSRLDDPFRRYRSSKFSKTSAGGHLGFWPIGAKPREIQLGKQQKWILHRKTP